MFDKYNNKDSLLIISGYPKRKEKYSQGVCAVSSFTKNTLLSLQKQNPQKKIIILTMTIGGKKEIYEEDNMLIVRCFERNDPLSYLDLIKYFKLFNKAEQTLVEFEFSTFGDTFSTILFAIPVFSLFFLRKKITLVMHQVIFDLKKMHGHIGISPKNPLLSVLNSGIKLFYKIICLPASKVIVLEEEFRQRLGKLIGFEKIVVIPHGVDIDIADSNIKSNNNDFVILFFGYISWYKGVDFLINTFKNIKTLNGRNINIVIAGGPSFTQEKKSHYQTFLKRVTRLSKLNSSIKITGFVKEKDIPDVFRASDLVVFPYRTFMSSSGPLSLTLSFKKPFILSGHLKDLMKSDDFKRATEAAEIEDNEIIFDFKRESLIELVKKSMNPQVIEKLTQLSVLLSEKRSFANAAILYDQALSKDLKKEFAPVAISSIAKI